MPVTPPSRPEASSCPDETTWMRYLDGEVDLTESLFQHLEACPLCAERLAEAATLLGFSDQAHAGRPVPVRRPRPRSRRAIVAAAAAALLAFFVVSLGAGRTTLADVLNIFQVKAVASATITPSQVQALMGALSRGGTVKLSYYGSVSPLTSASSRMVPVASLPTVARLPDLWPGSWGAATSRVTTANRITFRLNVSHINQLIAMDHGRQYFPAALNEVPFVLTVPESATTAATRGGVSYGLVELRQPALSLPAGVDVTAVRNAILGLPFLPPSLARTISSIGNWRNTLILPVMGQSRNVTMDGHPAVLEVSPSGRGLALVWEQDGVLVGFGAHAPTPIAPSQFVAMARRLFR